MVATLALNNITSWLPEEEAAIRVSSAESFGVPTNNVRIHRVFFDLSSTYVVQGLTLPKWAVASPMFYETMQQRLGFPINVAQVHVVAGDNESSLLHVTFNVQGIQDVGSAIGTKVTVSEIAMFRAIEQSLLQSFQTNKTHQVQVSVLTSTILDLFCLQRLAVYFLLILNSFFVQVWMVKDPVLEAVVQFNIGVPPDMQATDLAVSVEDVKSLNRFSAVMQSRGLEAHDVRVYLPLVIRYAQAFSTHPHSSSPPVMMTPVSALDGEMIKVSTQESSAPPDGPLEDDVANVGVNTHMVVLYASLSIMAVAILVCCCCFCCTSRTKAGTPKQKKQALYFIAPLPNEDVLRSEMKQKSMKLETRQQASDWSKNNLAADMRARGYANELIPDDDMRTSLTSAAAGGNLRTSLRSTAAGGAAAPTKAERAAMWPNTV